MQKALKFLSGATVPGRPAHVQAADAKQHAEQKLRLLKAAGSYVSFSEQSGASAQPDSSVAVRLKSISEPAANASSEISGKSDASRIAVPLVDSSPKRSGRKSALQASKTSLDALESEPAEGSDTTGLLRVALEPTADNGDSESGAISVKLHVIARADVKAPRTTAVDSAGPAYSLQAAAPAAGASQVRDKVSDTVVNIDDAGIGHKVSSGTEHSVQKVAPAIAVEASNINDEVYEVVTVNVHDAALPADANKVSSGADHSLQEAAVAGDKASDVVLNVHDAVADLSLPTSPVAATGDSFHSMASSPKEKKAVDVKYAVNPAFAGDSRMESQNDSEGAANPLFTSR